MFLSDEFKRNVNVLCSFDPLQETVTLNFQTKQYSILSLKKNSCFRNFIRWFIHLITFTLVPRNPDLDQVAQNILQETKHLKMEENLEETDQKKLLIAVENLYIATKIQGGSRQNKIEKLLQTIRSIKSLEPANHMQSIPLKKEQVLFLDGQEKIQTENEEDFIKFKELLAANTFSEQIIPYFEKIQAHQLDEISLERLLILATEMQKNPCFIDQKKTFLLFIQAIENKEDEDFLLDRKDQTAILLPFFSKEVQVILIGLLLRDGILSVVRDISRDDFLNQAKELPLEIWEAASKQAPNFFWDITLLPPAQCAAVVNGQMHNKVFINEFISRYFASDEADSQKICLSYLRPEIFSTKLDFNPLISSHIEAIVSLLDFFIDDLKLKHLLEGPFRQDYISQLLPGSGYLSDFFDHFHIHPWKLFFLLDDQEFNHSALFEWLNDGLSPFRDCVQNFNIRQWSEINKHIKLAFQLSENHHFLEALEIYNALPSNLQSLFVRFASSASTEELSLEIPHMCEGHFFIILSEGNEVRENFLRAFRSGLRNCLFSADLIRRIEFIRYAVDELEERFQEA